MNLKTKQNINRKQEKTARQSNKKGNTHMLKTLVISIVSLISGLVLASQPLSDTTLRAIENDNFQNHL